MKTPVQELIEWVDEAIQKLDSENEGSLKPSQVLRIVKVHLNIKLEKEKEHIIKTSKESYEYALLKRGLPIYRDEPNLESETYSKNYYNRNYNQTYKQNK
jgi:hypothetical protein